jgi:PAS domain S-box-containing protein
MSSFRLLWIGRSDESSDRYQEALETGSGDVGVDGVSDGREALDVLAKAPSGHLLVVIQLNLTSMELATLITSIKQINPLIEIMVIGEPVPSWSDLNLPRFYRPIFLDPGCSPDGLISCVAKLREIVEAKENAAQLTRGIGAHIGISRTSTEAILALLERQGSLGVIRVRRDGFFSSYNSEAQRLTGYDLEEVAHIQVWAQTLLVDLDTVSAFLSAVQSFWVKKSGRSNMRIRIAHKDGRVLLLSLSMLVLLDTCGNAREIVALFLDSSEGNAVQEYQILTEQPGCLFYTYFPERGFTRISASALDLLNQAFSLQLTRQSVLNRKVMDLPLPQDLARSWQARLEAAAAGASVSQSELSPMGLAGRRIMDHAFMARVRADSSNQFGALAALVSREDLLSDNLRDLSTETLAAKTLQQLPRPFVLLRAIRDATGTIQDFACIVMNQAASEILGPTTGSHNDLCFRDLFTDSQGGEFLFQTAREVTETGRTLTSEKLLTLRVEDKQQALLHLWLTKVGDGVAVFCRDVTDVREEERRMKQYHHIFSHMQEAIIVTDLGGMVTDWNPAAEQMFGYTKAEICGQSVHILTENLKGDQLEQQPEQILRDGDVWKGEYEFIRKDGTRGFAYTVFALLKDDQGKAYGTVGLCHDLTERKRLEERFTTKSQELQEKNIALNTLLRHAEQERLRACEHVAADLARKVKKRASKILQEKQNAHTVEIHAALLLQELGVLGETKPLAGGGAAIALSEKEVEVAQLIRLGKTTEEIAFILNKSPDTIRLQRISIRRKLGVARQDRNLAGHLKKLDLP